MCFFIVQAAPVPAARRLVCRVLACLRRPLAVRYAAFGAARGGVPVCKPGRAHGLRSVRGGRVRIVVCK